MICHQLRDMINFRLNCTLGPPSFTIVRFGPNCKTRDFDPSTLSSFAFTSPPCTFLPNNADVANFIDVSSPRVCQHGN